MSAKPTFRADGVGDATDAHQVGLKANAIARTQLGEDGALPTQESLFRIADSRRDAADEVISTKTDDRRRDSGGV